MAWSLKKIFLPDSSTKLLAGFERTMETVGSIVREPSVASARTRLTQAEAAGKGASVEYPWYFQIQGNLYVANGEKGATSGLWVLAPVNEVEVDERTYTLGATLTVTNGQYSNMVTTMLPMRPYDRVMTAVANAYGSATGNVDLCLQDGSSDVSLARFDAGDKQSATVTNSGVIPAGVTPAVRVGIRGGGPSGGKLGLSADAKLNRLVVTAYPITMA